MNRLSSILLLVILLCATASACSQPAEISPTNTLNLTSTPHPTKTSELTIPPTPIETREPTSTPTLRFPLLVGTPIPKTLVELTTENIGDLKEIARWSMGAISEVEFSSDTTIVAILFKYDLYIYDRESKAMRQVPDIEFTPNDIAFIPESNNLIISSKDFLGRWDVDHNSWIWETSSEQEITAIDVALDGRSIAAAVIPSGDDRASQIIRIYHANDGTRANLIDLNSFEFQKFSFTSESDLLQIIGENGIVKLIDLATGDVISEFGNSCEQVESLISFNRSVIALYCKDDDPTNYDSIKEVTVWDSINQEIINTVPIKIKGFGLNPLSLDISPEGDYLLIWAGDSHPDYIQQVDIQNNTRSPFLQTDFDDLDSIIFGFNNISFSGNGEVFSISHYSPGGWVIDIRKVANSRGIENRIEGLAGPTIYNPTNRLELSKDGLFWLSDTALHNMQNGQIEFRVHRPYIDPFEPQTAISPDSSMIAVGYSGSGPITGVVIWDVKNRSEINHIYDIFKNQYIWSVSFSPDGTQLAIVSSNEFDRTDSTLKIISLPEGELVHTLPVGRNENLECRHGHACEHLFSGWSPDGKYFFTEDKKTLSVFNPDNWEVLYTLDEKSHIYSFDVSDNSQLFAIGNGFGHVKIFNLSTGERLRILKTGGDFGYVIPSVDFSPDGKFIAAGSRSGGRIWVWDLTTFDLINIIDSHTFWKVDYNFQHYIDNVDFLSTNNGLLSLSSDGTISLWAIPPEKD